MFGIIFHCCSIFVALHLQFCLIENQVSNAVFDINSFPEPSVFSAEFRFWPSTSEVASDPCTRCFTPVAAWLFPYVVLQHVQVHSSAAVWAPGTRVANCRRRARGTDRDFTGHPVKVRERLEADTCADQPLLPGHPDPTSACGRLQQSVAEKPWVARGIHLQFWDSKGSVQERRNTSGYGFFLLHNTQQNGVFFMFFCNLILFACTMVSSCLISLIFSRWIHRVVIFLVFLLGALNFFISGMNTLCNKTIDDTLLTVKNYEDAR